MRLIERLTDRRCFTFPMYFVSLATVLFSPANLNASLKQTYSLRVIKKRKLKLVSQMAMVFHMD
jgi:hypothetical protein